MLIFPHVQILFQKYCLIILVYGNSKGPCHLGFPALLSSATQPRPSSQCRSTVAVYTLGKVL